MARVLATLAGLAWLGLVVTPGGMAEAQSPEPVKQTAAGKQDPPKAKSAAKKDRAAAPKAAEAAKAPRDPAATQKALESAQKALDGGKPEQTVSQINSLVEAGGLDAPTMARALALRGQAYKRQGKPAQAISDLQSALWLKGGLPEAERAAALAARAEAYREAGLGEPPALRAEKAAVQTAKASAPTLSTPSPTAAAPAAPVTTASVAAAGEPPKPSSGGVGAFLSNLFGGSKSTAPPPQTAQVAPSATLNNPAVSSWSNETGKPAAKAGSAVAAVPKAKEPPAAPPAAAAAAAAANATKAGSQFRMQLAAARSRDEAKALAERVRKEHGALIGQRAYEIDEATFGNMGKFYRVSIGAFTDVAEARTICTMLREGGIDCMLTSN